MNGRPFGEGDKQQLIRLLKAGKTDKEIGRDMKRHERFIRAKRTALGLAPGQSRALTAMMARLNYRRMVKRHAC
jgi:hypothetical protein